MTNKELRESCSLYNCKELKELIVNNPDLPLLVFVGEEAYSGEWGYEAVPNSCSCSISKLTLYKDMWMDKNDYKDNLIDDYSNNSIYDDLTDEEFFDMIDKKIKETEFIKAICVHVG